MRQRSADIATVIAYPFGAFGGWVLCWSGVPLWLAVPMAFGAGILANAISNRLWHNEMRRRADA